MTEFESTARNNHRNGMNCAMSVYDALSTNNPNKSTPPKPRELGGMCGAVLAAEKTIREMGGTEEDIAEFEKRFTEQHKYLKCSELRGFFSGKCNDYVGTAAAIVASMRLEGKK